MKHVNARVGCEAGAGFLVAGLAPRLILLGGIADSGGPPTLGSATD
ncbi:MAG: hypothetical protein AB8G16_08340 [Gammaproteobacteria bacterium]